MLIGYMRISKNDGSQTLDLQKDALIVEGVQEDRIYQDLVSGKKEARLDFNLVLRLFNQGIHWLFGSLTT